MTARLQYTHQVGYLVVLYIYENMNIIYNSATETTF